MFLVDSHCHLDQLDLGPFQGKLANAIISAKDQGVGHFLCVSITLEDFPVLCRIAKDYSGVSISAGLHPNELVDDEPSIVDLVKLGSMNKVVAIGETGLDYYRSTGDTEWQRDRFRRHIAAAKEIKKPLIVHSRQAREDTITLLREEKAERVGGVLHCFSEDIAMAEAAIDLNFYISFSGVVTFKNATALQAVAKQIPLDRLLIETDSPYLAPVPHRGKPNTPAYVRYVAEFIAALRGMDIAEFSEQTTKNFFTCFNGAEK